MTYLGSLGEECGELGADEFGETRRGGTGGGRSRRVMVGEIPGDVNGERLGWSRGCNASDWRLLELTNHDDGSCNQPNTKKMKKMEFCMV